MKHSTLTLLGLFLTPSLVLSQTKTGGPPAEDGEDEQAPPLTLLEKNKLAKDDKGKGGLPSGIETRVVGGQQVTQESKYPFFVQWEDAYCGGSLIHDDIVLSAAHCENRNTPFLTRVFVNGIESGQGVFRTVIRQESHPLYKVNDLNDYDFLLLKLDSSALVDANGAETGTSTVKLNDDSSKPVVGEPLMAVGYGLTSEGGSDVSDVLNDVEIYYVDDEICTSQYGDDTYTSALMFCAGVSGGGKDTCQGDSGGPIISEDSGEPVQYGVVSFGIGCARSNYNGVYARVSSATEWIEQKICELSDYPPDSCPPKPDNGGIGVGSGKVKISVKYDDYPSETGIAFVHDETATRLLFQPYQSPGATKRGSAEWSFDTLPAGDYRVQVGDQGRDGICCKYGNGEVVVTNAKNNAQVWKVTTFGEFTQGKFTIAENGDISFKGASTSYDNSWEASATPPNYPQVYDQSWPGPKPTDQGKMNINVKMDRYPEEVSYTLKKMNSDGNGWTDVDSFDGATEGVHNNIVSFNYDDLSEGWYELAVKDSGGDGICCSYRYGWVAVTGYLKATRKSGLVWGDNGEFRNGVTIYLQVDASGYFRQITEASPI